MRNIFLIAFLVLSSACHTMNLNNGAQTSQNFESTEFHHIVALRLAEISSPVVPSKICDNKWQTVRTRTGPVQVLVGMFVGGIYNPEEVSVSCQ